MHSLSSIVSALRRLHAARVVAVAVSTCALAASCGSAPSTPTGVLLVSVDSLRADHLSCYGYRSATRPNEPTSPAIDRMLAGEGTLFTRAVSTTSWTVPAHMALLSGLPNELHGVVGPADRLHPARALVPQTFAAAGWRTAGFFSGPNLHPWFGFGRGFERYEDCSNVAIDPERFAPATDAERRALREMEDTAHEGSTGGRVVESFTRWFSELEADEPFFAFVHLWDVHYDYAPPPEFDLFDPEYTGTIDGTGITDLAAEDLASERDLARLVALYDGEIRYTDDNVRRMLELLASAGRLDDTLVVFTSDHGDEFLEHGRFGHNKTLFEEVVHVPLILRHPPRVPQGRVDALVSLVDVVPTILDLCDLAPSAPLWGRSLRSAFAGELAPRLAPLELAFARPDPKLPRAPMQAVHAGDHKIVRERPGEPPHVLDLEADPKELAPKGLPKSDARLHAARTLWDALRDLSSELPATRGELPAELEDALRRVGYLGDE